MYRLVVILLLLIAQLYASSQLRITEHLLINNGLSNNYINDMVQDDKGRIWIATDSGLNCFSGSGFQSFNTGNSGLNSNMINKLWYDAANHQVWIGTKGHGVCVLDTESFEIKVLPAQNHQMNNVMDIEPGADGSVLVVSQTEVMCYHNNTFKTIPVCGEHGFLQAILDDGNGNLLVGHYSGGICILNQKNKQLRRLRTIAGNDFNDTVNDLLKDHEGRIWIAASSGLWYYLPGSSLVVKIDHLNAGGIRDIEEINGKELWVAANVGVWVLDLNSLTVNLLPRFRDRPSPTHNIKKIFQDNYGNIWLGSMGNGIDFFSHEQPPFLQLCKESIWGIYQDADGVWAGTTNKIMCFRDTTLIREIPIHYPEWRNSFVVSINSDNQGFLMVSYYGHLLQINKVTGACKEILAADGTAVPSLTFYKDEDGALWITSNDGIYTWKNGQLTKENALNKILQHQSTNGIRRDKQGKLWVATYENGIYIFDRNKKLLKHYNKQRGFLSNSIQHLYLDPHSRIWMSTPDGAGCINDTERPGNYKIYGYQQGLRDSYIRAILEDHVGNLWISTNNGISVMHKGKQKFENYTQYDGIPTNNFTGGAIEHNGRLYFTSLDGLCYLNPVELNTHSKPSDIHILGCMILAARLDYQKDSMLQADSHGVYHTSYNQNTFRILFGLSDYAQSRQAEYQYRLEGRDAAWIDLTSNVITFRKLSPGRYNISIRARLKGQDWNNGTSTSVQVYIHYPFWFSWWAILIYLLVAAWIVLSLFVRYRNRVQMRSELDRNAERLQFFTNITHELRTPLTLILGPLEDLKNKNNLTAGDQQKVGLIHANAQRLLGLVNRLLEFRKLETHNRKLTVCRADMCHSVKRIGEQFQQSCTKANVRIIIDVPHNPVELYYDEGIVTTILNNLLNNAYKYTAAGSIVLSLNEIGNQVVLTVKDTGYGIASESIPYLFDRYYQGNGAHQVTGTGIGLAIVKSLVELHEGRIQVESQENQGSTFTVIFNKLATYPNAIHKEPSVSGAQHVQSQSQHPTLLVIEDNDEILDYISSMLKDDYQILKADNGKSGLEKAFDNMPDIILSDIMMPVMDGIELCKRLKDDIRTSHIPLILLTAKDTMDDQQEGYESGADSYLTKPFTIQMLKARLQNLLKARQRLAHYLAANTAQTIQMQRPEAGLGILDQRFINDLDAIIEQNIKDPDISMAFIGEKMKMSHSTLYRKIKALTGLTGAEYIRKVRLRYSVHLMLDEHHNVSEAAYESGFSDLHYFRSCFKSEFGMTPTEYLKTPLNSFAKENK